MEEEVGVSRLGEWVELVYLVYIGRQEYIPYMVLIYTFSAYLRQK